MKKLLVPFLMLTVTFAACKKSDNCNFTETSIVASNAEILHIQTYLADSALTATPHPSGIFYNITTNGSGSKPDVCSSVSVKYSGKYFNGILFDQTEGNDVANFYLGELIGGWHKGLPLIGKAGKIRLYIPPSLGYGPDGVVYQGVEVIPPNAYLIFDIELIDVQ